MTQRVIAPSSPFWRYRDCFWGLLFTCLVQLLVVPTQLWLDRRGINLPASMLVMLLLLLLLVVVNYFYRGFGQVYAAYLKGPVDFLGRHMSFGFVTSFVMLNRDHVTDAADIWRIAAAFAITTLLNYITTASVALGACSLEHKLRGGPTPDTPPPSPTAAAAAAIASKAWPSHPGETSAFVNTEHRPGPVRSLSHLSEASMVESPLVLVSASPERGTSRPPQPPSTAGPGLCTGPVWICLVLLLAVGLPVRLANGEDMPLEALFFTLLWLLSMQLLRLLKASPPCCPRWPRLRPVFIICANPVLVTSALGSAYFWSKTRLTGEAIGAALDAFRRHSSLAHAVEAASSASQRTRGGSLLAQLGGGDVVCLVLDAGIVSLGPKMFEHRAQLWGSFLSMSLACSSMALAGSFLNVLLARAVGLRPADCLAFAAKTVTIALGMPAMESVGGSPTLVSALCIFSGMLFQMFGGLALDRLRRDRSDEDRGGASVSSSDVEEKEVNDDCPRQLGGGDKRRTESRVVATGVTVGINAAAMGTAQLIEEGSSASAYAALSMTIFGATTVALTAVPGLRALSFKSQAGKTRSRSRGPGGGDGRFANSGIWPTAAYHNQFWLTSWVAHISI